MEEGWTVSTSFGPCRSFFVLSAYVITDVTPFPGNGDKRPHVDEENIMQISKGFGILETKGCSGSAGWEGRRTGEVRCGHPVYEAGIRNPIDHLL